MTGLQQAVQWLAENAPEWTLGSADARLKPGRELGDPTIQEVSVELTDGNGVWVHGVAATHLLAAQAAVGALSVATSVDTDRTGEAS